MWHEGGGFFNSPNRDIGLNSKKAILILRLDNFLYCVYLNIYFSLVSKHYRSKATIHNLD